MVLLVVFRKEQAVDADAHHFDAQVVERPSAGRRGTERLGEPATQAPGSCFRIPPSRRADPCGSGWSRPARCGGCRGWCSRPRELILRAISGIGKPLEEPGAGPDAPGGKRLDDDLAGVRGLLRLGTGLHELHAPVVRRHVLHRVRPLEVRARLGLDRSLPAFLKVVSTATSVNRTVKVRCTRPSPQRTGLPERLPSFRTAILPKLPGAPVVQTLSWGRLPA